MASCKNHCRASRDRPSLIRSVPPGGIPICRSNPTPSRPPPARTLLLLEELNRHRVTSIDRLHKATGLPKSTVVRLMKSLCAMGYAANDRRQGGYAVASRVKSLSNGFHGDPLVVEAARYSGSLITARLA